MIAVSCRVYFGLSERRIAPECISRRRRLWNVEVSMHANQSPLIEEKHAATIYWKFRKFASNSCGVNRWHIGGCGILEGFVQHNELPCQQNDGMMCLFDCCFVVALTMNAIRHRQLLDLLQHNIFQACKINGVCQLCSSRRFLLVFLFCFFFVSVAHFFFYFCLFFLPIFLPHREHTSNQRMPLSLSGVTHTHTQNARCMCACMASSTPAWPPCHRNNAWLCMIGRDVCAEHSMNVRHCSHLLSSDCAAELTNCINQRCVKLTLTCIWSVAHVWLHSFVDDFPLNSNKLLENYLQRIGTNIALLEFYRIDSMIY